MGQRDFLAFCPAASFLRGHLLSEPGLQLLERAEAVRDLVLLDRVHLGIAVIRVSMSEIVLSA